jgi:hypothetical protein
MTEQVEGKDGTGGVFDAGGAFEVLVRGQPSVLCCLLLA